jgi:hypothetical protein
MINLPSKVKIHVILWFDFTLAVGYLFRLAFYPTETNEPDFFLS